MTKRFVAPSASRPRVVLFLTKCWTTGFKSGIPCFHRFELNHKSNPISPSKALVISAKPSSPRHSTIASARLICEVTPAYDVGAKPVGAPGFGMITDVDDPGVLTTLHRWD